MRPNEIIICDDCSSDKTVYIAKKILAQCNFNFKVFENDIRLGFENNFVRAMRLCQGDLIFLADQDDVWMPTKILKLYEAALEMPDKAVFLHDAYVCDINLWITHSSLFYSVNSSVTQFAYGFCMVVRQSIVQLFPTSPITIGHDLVISNVANCLNSKFYLSDKLAFYRRHVNTFTYLTSLKNTSLFKKFFYFDVALHTKSVLASTIVLFMVQKALSSSNRYSICDKAAIARVEKSNVETSTRLVYMKKSPFSRSTSIASSLFYGKITLFHALKDSISLVSES